MRHVFKPVELSSLVTPQIIDSPPIPKKGGRGDHDDYEDVLEQENKERIRADEARFQFEDEIEEAKARIEEDLKKKEQDARLEAEKIIQDAKEWAFQKVKTATEDAEIAQKEAEHQAKTRIEEAQEEEKHAYEEAQKKVHDIEKSAYEEGYNKGSQEGFNEGREEADRLTDRSTKVLKSIIEKRDEVLRGTEEQLISIILSIVRKVVKFISETEKEVVRSNINEALSKIKERSEITIRVNTEDLHIMPRYKTEFIERLEGVKNVQVLEDNHVDPGGCIIETDFGSIDARVSTQLAEIERQIRDISPYREEP